MNSKQRSSTAAPKPAPGESPPLAILFLLGGFAQMAMTVPMFAAPFVAREFGLSDGELTFLSGVISLGAFGTFALTRLADRYGRRPVLRAGFAALGPLSLATAAAPAVTVYVAAQLAVASFRGALGAIASVAITEVSYERTRARTHGWYGFISSFASAIPLLLAALIGEGPNGWRILFATAGATVLALPWVWRRTPETARFEKSRVVHATRNAGACELLAPAYRRRALGLVVVGVLRGAGLGALGFYAFHHAIQNLGLESWQAAAVFGGAGTLGSFGNAAGAILSERWGRRPTQVGGVALAVASGVAYYWVPAGPGPWTLLGLGAAFFGYVLGVQTFGVADRLLDTELFPTRLRSTYAGLRMIGDAASGALQNFGLSAAIAALGSLELAVSVLVPTLVVPATGLLLWATTETQGMELDQAALEEGTDSAPHGSR